MLTSSLAQQTRSPQRRLCGFLTGLYALVFLPSLSPQGLAQDDQDLLGEPRQFLTWQAQTLKEVARRHHLELAELQRANPDAGDALLPRGTLLALPSGHLLPNVAREGIVVNLAESRLYAFTDGPEQILSFPIAVASQSCGGAIGQAKVSGLRQRPTWTPPPAWHALDIKLPETLAPGPNNPLGALAIDLDIQGYVLHEAGGPRRSISDKGCIGLAYHDIARLFERVDLGTRVNVIDQPVKLGWSGGALYLEVHPPRTDSGWAGPLGVMSKKIAADQLEQAVRQQAWGREDEVDWDRVFGAASEKKGLPVRVTGRRGPSH